MIKEITPKEINERKVANLPTRPNNPRLYGGERLSPEQLKERFDALSLLAINRLNTLIAMINDGKIADEIPVLTIGEGDDSRTFTISELADKVVDGSLPDIMKVYEGKTLRALLAESSLSPEIYVGDGDMPENATVQFIPPKNDEDGFSLKLKKGDGTIITVPFGKGDKGDAGAINFKVVNDLPSENIENAIYLVPSDHDEDANLFSEYIYVNGRWEKIGSAGIEINLDGYVKQTDLDHAVKVGITTNAIPLTDEEKATALEWLGAASQESIGDISTALDELHAYAQALVNGGATE
jgi:hypothetical protein